MGMLVSLQYETLLVRAIEHSGLSKVMTHFLLMSTCCKIKSALKNTLEIPYTT